MPDRVLLNGTAHDYTLSRSPRGAFVLDTHQANAGVETTLTINQTVEAVQFGDGQYLAVRDLPFYIMGDATLASGTSANDILIAAAGGNQSLVGGDGIDDAYLRGNAQDYRIALVDRQATVGTAAVYGYELQAINGSGDLFIARSTEVIHFQSGQYHSFADLPAYIVGA